MLKDLILALPVLFLTSLINIPLTAQTRQIDLSAGIGFVSFDQLNIELGSERGPLVVNHSSFISFVSGKYFLAKKFAIGVTVATQNITGNSNDTWISATGHTPFSYNMTTLTIAPEITLAYVRRKFFIFYTILGAGYDHYFVNYSYYNSYGGNGDYKIIPNNINWQYTPLGFRFGNTLSGFLELGLGYKGLLNFGMSYRIGKSGHPSIQKNHPIE